MQALMLATLTFLALTAVNGREATVKSAQSAVQSSEVNQHGGVGMHGQSGSMMRREDKDKDKEKHKTARPGSSLADTKEAALQQKMVEARQAMKSPQQAPPQLDPSLSAYEVDIHNPEESEYFGPFRIDYHDHTINLEDWNLVVESPREQPGRGNFVVGNQDFVADSTNSAVFGKHDTARGLSEAVVGFDNVAEGEANSLIGGQNDVAKGNSTAVAGGYGNEAKGNFGVACGGDKDVAEGDFGVACGGHANDEVSKDGVAKGGTGNVVKGEGATVDGGDGNMAVAQLSTIASGEGGITKSETEVISQASHSDDH